MMNTHQARKLGAWDMAELLDTIIKKGGTSAHTDPVSWETMLDWMTRDPERSEWHVAKDELGSILGFQFIEPHTDLPSEACDVATFVRPLRQNNPLNHCCF